MLVLALTAHEQNYWLAAIGFLGYGIGAPLVISPAIATVLGSVPAGERGMAAGILNTMRQLGAALCFAIVGVVITNIMHHGARSSAVSYQLLYSHAFSIGMFVAVLFALIAVLMARFGLVQLNT